MRAPSCEERRNASASSGPASTAAPGVFRDGVGIVARWSRPYVNQPLSLTETATGAPIYLKPGITFYEVLGTNSYADQDAGEWHFHHATP